jgi:predicted transcriptional regulator of viral defense system
MDGDELKSTADLAGEEGLSRYALLKASRAGEWDHVRRGVYARPREMDDHAAHRRLVLATLPEIASESVVSHLSAAALHGLPLYRGLLDRVWVTRPEGGHGRHGSVLHLRRCRLEDDEVTVIDGVRVTTLARTASDLARLLPYEWGVIACDAALNAGLGRDELLEIVDRAAGWPGARRAWSVSRFADGLAASPAESVSRVQIRRLGFPTPQLQFEVHDNGVVATTDFAWEDEGLVGECDGAIKYGRLLKPGQDAAAVVMAEKRREERIRGAGFWIVRWGWSEAWQPRELERILRRGFELAPRIQRHSA